MLDYIITGSPDRLLVVSCYSLRR